MANQSYTITSPSWDGSLNTKFMDIISPTTSFSGTDIVVSFAFDASRAVVVGTLATMTYSVYREKRQVRTLGRISMRGVTKGPMTVAGTMIFSVINQHVVNDIRNAIAKGNASHPLANPNLKRIRMDELPPFDVILTFGNEYGQSAKMVIYGVTMTDEAMTFSIEDMFTENVMTYMARDIETMRGPFSPDMALYVDTGTTLGGGQKLPKYGFDTKNLWNQTLDSYQQRVQALVDKANRDYGASYNAPDYSGFAPIQPQYDRPAGPPAPNSYFGTVQVKVVDDDTNQLLPGVAVGMTTGSNTGTKTTDGSGFAKWDNIPGGTTVIFTLADTTNYQITSHSSVATMPSGSEADGALITALMTVKKIKFGMGGNSGADIPSTDPPKIQLTVTDQNGKGIPGVTVKIKYDGFDSGTGNSASNGNGQIMYEAVTVGKTVYSFAPQDPTWNVVSDPGSIILTSDWAGKIRKLSMVLSR